MSDQLRREQTSPTRVLVIDDDEGLRKALERGLSLRGFDVRLACDAGEALPFLSGEWPEVTILDIMMPGLDGLAFCQLVRERVTVPILMLTARDSVPDRVAGLEAGADDYLVKPFELDELVARLRALTRRGRERQPANARLSYRDVALDTEAWTATRGMESLNLTALEFRVLEQLLRFSEQVLYREAILRTVWGEDWLTTHSNIVDVHVAKLRQKLEAHGRSRLIQTVRYIGYILKEE
jgi:two-component system response regulator MprA